MTLEPFFARENDAKRSVWPTRTVDTEAQYRRRFQQLWAQFVTGNQGSPLTLLAYAEWLLARREFLKAASFRQYRSASVFVLEEQSTRTSVSAYEQFEKARALALLQAPMETGADGWFEDRQDHVSRPKGLRRTSARKLKSVSFEDWDRLSRALDDSHGEHARWVRSLLSAGLVTGLRPSEWLDAVLAVEPGSACWMLKVANGKASNGRSHGATRTLRWPSAGAEVDAIADWLTYLNGALPENEPDRRRAWRDLYACGRACLYETNRRLWPRRQRHISFYTTRHMFAAACKEIYTREELGALLGHATDVTATRHYARPSRRTGGVQLTVLPKPDPIEVVRVRLLYNQKMTVAREQRPTGLDANELGLHPNRGRR